MTPAADDRRCVTYLDLRSSPIEKTLTLPTIALVQLFGLGLLVLGQVAGARQGYRFSDLHLIALVVVVSATLSSSLGLLRRRRQAIITAIALQMLQIVAISTAGFTFQLALGPVARIQFWTDVVNMQFGAYGSFVLGFARLAEPPLMVNLIPLILLGGLWRQLKLITPPHSTSSDVN